MNRVNKPFRQRVASLFASDRHGESHVCAVAFPYPCRVGDRAFGWSGAMLERFQEKL